MRWLLGLGNTLYVWFLPSLALSMGLTSVSWTAVRSHPEGILIVTPLFFGLLYCLFSLIRLPAGPVSLFWSRRLTGEFMIAGSLGGVVLVGLLGSGGLGTLPAYLVRDGLLGGSLTVRQVNVLLLIGMVVGYLTHDLYHRLGQLFGRPSGPVEDPSGTVVSPRRFLNMVLVLGAGFLFALLYFTHVGFQDFVHEATGKLLRADIDLFRDYLLSFGVWAPVVSAFLMVFVLVVAPPLPAFVVTFTNGLLFGAFWGTLLSWSSAMVGAALSFYIARAFGRPAVENLFPEEALEWTDRFFHRYGIHSVLLARLVPVVSFALVSYAAGLTAMRFLGYFVATGIGQLPATIVYSWLGEHATGSVMYVFWAFVAVAVLAVFGAAVRTWLKRNQSRPQNV